MAIIVNGKRYGNTTPGIKRCSSCREALPLAAFNKNASASQGVHNRCRVCHRANRKKPIDLPLPATRKCSGCGESYPATQEHFYPSKLGAFGLQSCCKACSRSKGAAWKKANPERVRDAGTAWEKANRHRRRDSFLRRTHGISVDEYERRLMAQGNKCAICGTPAKSGERISLDVDHDHETGAVRGLLCNSCNQGLGYLRDDPARLRAAATYLETVPSRAI